MRAQIVSAIVVAACTFLTVPAHAQNWVDITPASGPAPTPRTLASAVYNSLDHTMVVFGGQDAGGRTNEVWSFDLTTHLWTDLTPGAGSAPAGRRTPATVYDIDNHQLLTFSGQGTGGTFFNDTWGFDLTTSTWTEFAPPSPPTIRYGVATCYDAVAGEQVIFAGFTFQGRFDDTQRFNPLADTWTDVSPVSGSPLERCLHSAFYDGLDRLMIMYGGQNGGPLGDIWSFDLATETWTDLTPGSGPDPRWFTVFEYDALNHRATMFSGNRSALGKGNDVWVFDLTTGVWHELTPGGIPPVPRDGAVGVYVENEDRMVVFGGSPASGYLGDVWSLENLSDTPTGIVPDRDDDTPPQLTTLFQNYPNPFNPSTVIGYELVTASRVSLGIYDLRGRLVRTLVDEDQAAGYNSALWDGRNDAGSVVTTGVYMYRLQANEFKQTRKMLFLK